MITTYRDLSEREAKALINSSPKGAVVSSYRDTSTGLWTVTIREHGGYTK